MKEIIFNNEKVENEYNKINKDNPGLEGVILSLKDDNELKIVDTFSDDTKHQLIIAVNNGLMSITVDKLMNKIRVVDPYKDYTSVYDNYPKMFVAPTSLDYQKGNRIISKKNNVFLNEKRKDYYHYRIKEDEIFYEVIIIDLIQSFNNEEFIKNLLNTNIHFDNINMLLVAMKRNIPLTGLNIKITDAKGSIAIINNGSLLDYQEYREINNEYHRIFLEDNKFYIEKKVNEEYNDDNLQYIKRR